MRCGPCPNIANSCSFAETFMSLRTFPIKTLYIMSNKRKTSAKVWTVIGVVVLIVLLLLWLTDAMSMGDTDVNAPLTFIGNQLGNLANVS